MQISLAPPSFSHVKVVNHTCGHALGMSARLLWMKHLNDDVYYAEP